jgi:hypothetical protein
MQQLSGSLNAPSDDRSRHQARRMTETFWTALAAYQEIVPHGDALKNY